MIKPKTIRNSKQPPHPSLKHPFPNAPSFPNDNFTSSTTSTNHDIFPIKPHHLKPSSSSKPKQTQTTSTNYDQQLQSHPLYIQIKTLWDELGVTLSYRTIFNSVSLQLDKTYRDNYFSYELKQLTRLSSMINKANNEIDSREKTIELLINTKKTSKLKFYIFIIKNSSNDLPSISVVFIL